MLHRVQPSRLCQRPDFGAGLTFNLAQASIPLSVDIITIAWLLFDEAHYLERTDGESRIDLRWERWAMAYTG